MARPPTDVRPPADVERPVGASPVAGPRPVTLDDVFQDDDPVVNFQYEQFKFTKQVARWIMQLFAFSTIVVVVLVTALALVDVYLIMQNHIEPADRLITESVIMTVIAATFVQVGAAAFAIVRSVFKLPEQPEPVNAQEPG